MKKLLTCLMAALGLGTACSPEKFATKETADFAPLTERPDVVVVDARTADEYAEDHLDGAVNIDIKDSQFREKALSMLPLDKTVAVYCLRGRRSAKAAKVLADEGYTVVNLKGGIQAWKAAGHPVTKDTHERDIFVTPGGKSLRFYALMHGSIRMAVDDKELYIDPVRKLGDRTVDYKQLPPADYIFVTHEHGDHADKGAVDDLMKVGTRLITNLNCPQILGFGFSMKNGDTERLCDLITVDAVPAYNITPGREQFHPKGRDNGFVLTIDGLRIYVAGDTEDIPEMAELKDIDIAFLPCNQPYTMTPEQLLRAARVIRPKVLFPYHYGQTDLRGVADALKADGIEVRIRHYE